jgi:antitoxin component of MazEF toxin-antitoxin module
MQTKIAKWGNSYAVRIPEKVVARLSLNEGEPLAVDVVGDSIKISSLRKKIPHYNLKELLKGMKPRHLTKKDRDWLDMPEVGKEIVEW